MKFSKLKGKRVECGYTQKTISAKLGLSTGAYALKELGKRQFTIDEISIILNLLNCKFEDIFLN